MKVRKSIVVITLGAVVAISGLTCPVTTAGTISGATEGVNSATAPHMPVTTDSSSPQVVVQPTLPSPPQAFGPGAMSVAIPIGEQPVSTTSASAGHAVEPDSSPNLPLVIAFGISLALNIYFITTRFVFRNR